MKLNRILAGTVVIAVLCYLFTPGMSKVLAGADLFAWRKEMILMTGISAFACMGLAMLLAVRPAWLENWMGGLDKGYALHKWLGITSGVFILLHWLLHDGMRWLVDAGLIQRPPRPGGGRGGAEAGFSFEGFAHSVGKWTFYIMAALVVLALVKRFPYKYFRWVHKAFAVVFLAGAFHGLMLMPKEWWALPAGWLMVIAAVVGSVAAVWSLAGMIGKSRTHIGTVQKIDIKDSGIVDLQIRVNDKGIHHKAGQFAFVKFDSFEGAHPFTIASAGGDPRELRFAIKPLGDYTRTLGQSIKPGQVVEVEGPYGRFDFGGDPEREVWVAGGIGIAPFMARLDELAQSGGATRLTELWYCTVKRSDAAFPEALEAACDRAGVRLRRMIAEEDGLLTADRLAAGLGDLSRTLVWFCGPIAFSRSLREGLVSLGLPATAFHTERFSMR